MKIYKKEEIYNSKTPVNTGAKGYCHRGWMLTSEVDDCCLSYLLGTTNCIHK